MHAITESDLTNVLIGPQMLVLTFGAERMSLKKFGTPKQILVIFLAHVHVGEECRG